MTRDCVYWPWWFAACGESEGEFSLGGGDCCFIRLRSYSSAKTSHCSNSTSIEGVPFFMGLIPTEQTRSESPLGANFCLYLIERERAEKRVTGARKSSEKLALGPSTRYGEMKLHDLSGAGRSESGREAQEDGREWRAVSDMMRGRDAVAIGRLFNVKRIGE